MLIARWAHLAITFICNVLIAYQTALDATSLTINSVFNVIKGTLT